MERTIGKGREGGRVKAKTERERERERERGGGVGDETAGPAI